MPDSDDLGLSDAELALFRELDRAKVQFIVVGLAAAVLQGADTVTKDVDLWFQSIADPAVGRFDLPDRRGEPRSGDVHPS